MNYLAQASFHYEQASLLREKIIEVIKSQEYTTFEEYGFIGLSQKEYEMVNSSEKEYETAVRLYRDLIADNQNQPEYQLMLARCLHGIGLLHYTVRSLEKSETELKEAASLYELFFSFLSEDIELLNIYGDLADMYIRKNEYEIAEKYYQTAYDTYTKIIESRPQLKLQIIGPLIDLVRYHYKINQRSKVLKECGEIMDILNQYPELDGFFLTTARFHAWSINDIKGLLKRVINENV